MLLFLLYTLISLAYSMPIEQSPVSILQPISGTPPKLTRNQDSFLDFTKGKIAPNTFRLASTPPSINLVHHTSSSGTTLVTNSGGKTLHSVSMEWKPFQVPEVIYVKSQHIDELYYDGTGPVYVGSEIWMKTQHPFSQRSVTVVCNPTKVHMNQDRMNIYAKETILGSKSYPPYPVLITIFNRDNQDLRSGYEHVWNYYRSYDSKSSHLMYKNDRQMIVMGPQFTSF